jgi:hypothetical protein
MDYYTNLLQSYSKIKKRSFNPLNEAKDGTSAPKKSTVSDAAHELALQYINRAVSLKDQDNYVVDVPESKDPGTQVFVAREGKRSGQVVVKQGGSAALPVTDLNFTPLRSHPAYKVFSASLDKTRKDLKQSVTEEQPEEEMMGQQIDPLFNLPVNPVSYLFHEKISKSSTNLYNLAQNYSLMLTYPSIYKKTISTIGPGGKEDYSMLRDHIDGDHPLSLKNKMANSISVQILGKEDGTKVTVQKQLSTRQKEIVAEKFERFTDCVTKLYNSKFTADDLKFLENSMKVDGDGIWILDTALEDGVCLVGRTTPPNVEGSYRQDVHLFPFLEHVISKTNRLINQWDLQQKMTRGSKGIRISRIKNISERETAEFNSVRGNSAENYRIVIDHAYKNDYKSAAVTLKDASDKFEQGLIDAYKIAIPFERGEAAADRFVIDKKQLVDNIRAIRSEKSPKKNLSKNILKEVDIPTVDKILPKLIRFEKDSLFLRKPEAIQHTGNKEDFGFNADMIEFYSSEDDVQSLLTEKYGMNPVEAQSFRGNLIDVGDGDFKAALPIGLKTYTIEGKAKLAERGMGTFHRKLQENHPHTIKALETFQLDHNIAVSKVREVDTIMLGVENLFTNKIVPGYSREEVNINTINGFLEKLKLNSNYDDLAKIEGIKPDDLSNATVKRAISNRIKRAIILSKLKTECNKVDKKGKLTEDAINWRKYVSTMIYSQAASEKEMLTECRYFNTGNNYIINNNKALREELSKFINGEYKISSDKKGIHISTGKQYGNVINCWFTVTTRKYDSSSLLNTIYLRRDAIRRHRLNPVAPTNESISEEFLEGMITELLDIYYLVKDKNLQ